jgi:acyl-CoA oxidase
MSEDHLLEMENLTRELYSLLYPEIDLYRIRFLKTLALEKKDLMLDYQFYYENPVELQNRAIRYAVNFSAFIRELDLNRDEIDFIRTFYPDLTVVESNSYFYEALEFLGTSTQASFYRHLIENNQIIGSYSQAELGNGGNLNGIETQVIYNREKQEFIVNSPTITSSKYWIGGVGVNANFTLLVARLVIDGKDYGPHAFITQIRNFRSHKAVHGAFIGEVGPKMGLTSSDQGFARYEFLTLPKTALLNRFSNIDNFGNYSSRFDSKEVITITNLIARVKILSNFWAFLAPSLSISLKYSVFRRQFPDPEKPNQEVRLIDYQIQQEKLFPGLCRLFCFTFSLKSLKLLLKTVISEFKQGNNSSFDEIFCLASLFKAGITERTAKDLELSRRACGGHGYLKLAGLSTFYCNYLPCCTYAGDNSVISIEAMRVIIRNKPKRFWQDIINNQEINKQQFWLNQVAKAHLQSLDSKFNQLVGSISEKEIWDSFLQVEALKTADALFLCLAHKEMLRNFTESKNRKILKILRNVFFESETRCFEADFRKAGIKDEEWQRFRDLAFESYEWIRENCLGLIESFEIPDEILNSVLSKGNPYEEMVWTSKNLNPVNKMKKGDILKVLRPKI